VRRWLPWVLLAVVVVSCLAVAVYGSRSAPTAEQRVTEIGRTIKCPTCAGESVSESNSPAAKAIRADIAERVQQGQTDDQIRDYYAGRYDDILLTPPASGVSLLVWVLPLVAIAVAIAALAIAFRRWSVDPAAGATEADRVLVAEALRQEHEGEAPDDPHGEGSSR
jgi:cytochrome c-type biogenesis protein CcmH